MSSKIEWTDETWNPITGCSPISQGCQNCYAKRMANRLRGRYGYPKDDPFRVTGHPAKLNDPFKWKKPRMIFVCSMGDLFHENVDWWYQQNVMYACIENPQHTFLFLTKRPERMKNFLASFCNVERINQPIKNLWLGVTAENQKRADERIPILLQIPAKVRFVSVEPMLGQVNPSSGIENRDYYSRGVDWVICGAETGPGARTMKAEWAVDLWEQCNRSVIPFFIKKESPKDTCPDHIKVREYPTP